MLRRTMDAAFLNTVANHEAVRPWLGGSEQLDLTPVLANPENVALVNEFGGFVGVKLDGGLYECHSVFLPDGRGALGLAAAAEGLRYLFVETDCIEVVTKVPKDNQGALGLSRAMGFSKVFERENAWPTLEGERIGVDYFSLPFAKWRSRDPLIEERGIWFHSRLEDLTTDPGKPIPAHEDDPAHNRAVGAAVLMLASGNTIKACGLYNRWAAFSGYPGIKLISSAPAIIDMNEAVVSVRDGDMEVLLCR